MDSNLLNISSVEDFFHRILYKNLSDNIFFTSLPNTIKSEWKDMVLVDLDITDNGIGSGFANIFLYPKSKGSSKNTKALNELERNLNKIINSSKDEHYKISRLKTYSDYDYARKLYYTVVSIIIYIV